MKRTAILAVVLVFVSLCLAIPTDLTAVWPRAGVPVVGLVLAAIAASLLVLYFGWRRRLIRSVLAEHEAHADIRKAA